MMLEGVCCFVYPGITTIDRTVITTYELRPHNKRVQRDAQCNIISLSLWYVPNCAVFRWHYVRPAGVGNYAAIFTLTVGVIGRN